MLFGCLSIAIDQKTGVLDDLGDALDRPPRVRHSVSDTFDSSGHRLTQAASEILILVGQEVGSVLDQVTGPVGDRTDVVGEPVGPHGIQTRTGHCPGRIQSEVGHPTGQTCGGRGHPSAHIHGKPKAVGQKADSVSNGPGDRMVGPL